MASLMQTFEQQYSALTAEVTVKIGKVPNLHGGEKLCMISDVEHQIDEVKELLEQMDLEVHNLSTSEKPRYKGRVKSYQQDLANLEKDFRKSRIALSAKAREQLIGEEGEGYDSAVEDQRQRLLDNSERLERSGKKLDVGYRVCVETEDIGNKVLEDLSSQRETITRARDRIHDMDSNLGKSSRVLSTITKRLLQNRLALFFVGLVLFVTVVLLIYYVASR